MSAQARPGVLKPNPLPAFQVAEKRTFFVAVCKSQNSANPFSWSITKIDLFLYSSSDREGLDSVALIEALRGEHDMRDGVSRSAAVRAEGSAEDSASYYSFHWVRGCFLLNRVGEVVTKTGTMGGHERQK